MGRLFGTDGIRGTAGVDLTADLALRVAAAAVAELVAGRPAGSRPMVVVGRDPRPSGELLEAAVVAGLLAAGADVTTLGVVPTPALAYAVAAGLSAGAPPELGVMITASHNPMPDNGLKLFAAGGRKLPDAVEDRIAARLADAPRWAVGDAVGRRHAGLSRHGDWYADHLLASLATDAPATVSGAGGPDASAAGGHDGARPLGGLRVVVDCANGAASAYAPAVYRRAGADVVALHDEPGPGINDGCGATDLASLQAAVVAHRADAGIAHDGDADRCLAVDATGEVVDGDQILAVLAVALREQGRLAADTVVATVMSNLGFHHAMRDAGVTVVTTPVGDRYVLEAMRDGGYSLGGEQSGHVVLADHATTGDGLLTALHLLRRMAATGHGLAELAAVVTRLPQVLVNVRGVDRSAATERDEVRAAVRAAEAELGDTGRVLLRPSGTEPLVRVMVEAATADRAREVAERLAAVVRGATADL